MDFPGCPVVGGMGSIPEQGTQIPHAVQYSQKKKRQNPATLADSQFPDYTIQSSFQMLKVSLKSRALG